MGRGVSTEPTAFEPALPRLPGPELDGLRALARELASKAEALAPEPTPELVERRRFENARASNAIERVTDAEALAAHVEVERLVDQRIEEARERAENFDPMSPDFFRWIHAEFYHRMPEKLRRLEDGSSAPLEVISGEIRDRMVAVGSHWCPEPAALPELLEHFHNRYRLDGLHSIEDKLIAAMASHSRFEWIHPFLDGNGRVGRLALHAALSWMLPRGVWWSVSAGLERDSDGYIIAIGRSQWARAHDADGRGPLSERELLAWIRFMLVSAIDEITRQGEPEALKDK